MPSFFHYFELESKTGYFEVVIDINYIITSDSLGMMEIHGHKIYDRQPDYAVCEEYTIKNIINLDTKQEINIKNIPTNLQSEIESYFENNIKKLNEVAWEDNCEKLEDDRY